VGGGARCAAGAADELCARGRCRHFDGWKWSNVTKPSLLGWARRSARGAAPRLFITPNPQRGTPPNRTGVKVFWQRI